MMLRLTNPKKAMFIAALSAVVYVVSTPAADSMQIVQYLRDIQAGPSIFYTPEAYAYFVARSNMPPYGVSTDRDAAMRSYSAITRVSHLPPADVRGAIPIIVTQFPKLVHLVQVREAVFGGNEGTFDDCVGTYVTSAKNQFMVFPPILDYNFMSQYENFIDESHEIEFISKRLGAAGQLIEATFNLKIFFTVYIGEGALSRLTGQTLGHDQNTWRQWETGFVPAATPTYAHYYAMPAAIASGTGYIAVTPPVQAMQPPQTVPVSPISSQQFIPGRTYRVSLTTGNDLEGKALSRDETSVTLLTAAGKPYVITFTLIRGFEPIEPLPSGQKSP